MTKLLSVMIATMFAAVSVNAIAASPAGAPKDDSKMETTDKMGKMDKMEKKAKTKKGMSKDKMDKMDKKEDAAKK